MEIENSDKIIGDARKLVTSIKEHLNEDTCRHTLKQIVKEALEIE